MCINKVIDIFEFFKLQLETSVEDSRIFSSFLSPAKKLQRGNDFSRVCLSFCLSVCLSPGEDAGDSPVMTREPVQTCSLGDPLPAPLADWKVGSWPSTEGLLVYLIRYTYLARRCFICPAKKVKAASKFTNAICNTNPGTVYVRKVNR